MLFIIKDKYLRAVFGISLAVLIITSIIVFLKLRQIYNPLVIHFDAYSGIDFFGEKTNIFGILATTFAAIGINFFLADFLYNRERFLSYIFAFVSLELVILMAMSVIISVN